MGKAGKWIKNFFAGKKDREKESKSGRNPQIPGRNGEEHQPTPPRSISHPTTPNDKRRWSFRSHSASASSLMDRHMENESKKHALAVAAAADAAVAAARAAAALIQLTAGRATAVEEAAAVKIQSVFRAHLARKALIALRGLVKLQALVRGHLVRKQATATLRCMQALATAQARARARRLHNMAEETKSFAQAHFMPKKPTQENKFRDLNKDFDKCLEENIKVVDMNNSEHKPVTTARKSHSNRTKPNKTVQKMPTSVIKEHHQISPPSPAVITDMSPRTCSNHFDKYSFRPQCYSAISRPDPARLPLASPKSEYADSLYNDHSFDPNYMANTESSRAKVRSHSTPKQRVVETFERQHSRQRAYLEGKNVPVTVGMQRSWTRVGSTAQKYQHPWSVKLDRSTVSLKDSECGSTSTVLTNADYCRSLVGFDAQGERF